MAHHSALDSASFANALERRSTDFHRTAATTPRRDGYPIRVDAWEAAWSELPLPAGAHVEHFDAQAGSGRSHDKLLHIGAVDAAVAWSGSSGIVYLPLELDETGWSVLLNALAEVARRLDAVVEDDDGGEVGP